MTSDTREWSRMDVEAGASNIREVAEESPEMELLQDPFAAPRPGRAHHFSYTSSAASSSSEHVDTAIRRRNTAAHAVPHRHNSVRDLGDRVQRVSARVAARVANVGAVEPEARRPIEMIDRGNVEDDSEDERLLGGEEPEDELEPESEPTREGVLRGKSLGVFGPEHPLRLRLLRVLQQP